MPAVCSREIITRSRGWLGRDGVEWNGSEGALNVYEDDVEREKN